MDIVIIANFCGKLDGSDNNRFIYLADELVQKYDVELITCDFEHGSKSYYPSVRKKYPFKITLLHENAYKKNVSLRRFYSHFVWGRNVKKNLKKRKKPDVVYCAVPSLTASVEAARQCKKRNIRFIIDVQDLWPDGFKLAFNVPVISDLLFKPFKMMADYCYRAADEICAVSQTYADRAMMVNKKSKKSHVVFLGTCQDKFDRFANENRIAGKPEDELWIAYCGTLGKSYDLTCVIDALSIIKENGFGLPKFIVMGDGPRKREFEEYAEYKDINAVFTGNLPYDRMCGLLQSCDIAVNPISHNAAQSIINKHADYAAAGLPVINTQENTEYRSLVSKYHMGFNCKNGDEKDVSKKLELLINSKELRFEMGRNARKCFEEKFNRNNTYEELIQVILQ